jgi:hypothetical protein
VKDVDAIIHAASPVIFKGNDPEGKENPLNASARLVIPSLPDFLDQKRFCAPRVEAL